MPPELNIYGLTKHRDEATINRFLDTYADRFASEDRGDEQLMMLPLGTSSDIQTFDDYEWEPAQSLTHIIQRGTEYPRRAFTVYLSPKHNEISRVILSFTSDDQLVIGLGIDDEGMRPERERQAKTLLQQIVERYACHAGLITSEMPPPLSEPAFRDQSRGPLTVFFNSVDGCSQS